MALEGVVKGKIKKPHLVLIYGPDGVGKSTFGAEAPNPIFLGPESGSNSLDVSRFTAIDSWTKIKSKLNDLIHQPHDFKTVVLDSIDWAEPLLWRDLCARYKVDAVEDVAGGYGKWVAIANAEWKLLMNDLSALREKGINIIAIAHAHVKPFNDPNTPLPYDRYQLKLNDKAAAIWREYVDCVLFANFAVATHLVNKTDKKKKANDGGTRKIFTVRTASYDAKNRLGLPPELPLSYSEFAKSADLGQPEKLDVIKKEIEELASKLDDATKEKMLAAVEKAGPDIVQLSKIKNHARVIVGE
jgi:DNA polymerase III delta prime subunit